jgi:glycosyltransferase involved in cell wall biosynthesis
LVKNHLFHQLPALVFAPAQEDEKANIKNQLTNGCEYFLCSAAFVNKKNLVNLLKAFSIFKKRFKNQFVLVLSGISVKNHTLISVISGYKYRNDIVVLPENLMHSSALVMASCYAHIGTADDIYPYDIIACFASGIPVIVDNTMYEPAETELFLTYTNDDVQGLAAQMMLLYKDESLRDRMIRSSRAYMDQIRQDADDPNRLNSILRKADI